ncbi:MAG: DUF6427 family protein [Lentimicrobium sp.]
MIKRLAKAGIFPQIIVLIILALVYYITPQTRLFHLSVPDHTAPLGEWIYRLILNYADMAQPLVVILLVSLAITLNALLIRHDISPRQSLLPAIVALILMLFTPDAFHLIVTLACLILLLFSLHNIMGLYGEQHPYSKVLNATFAISIASMISPPVILFIFFVWFGFFTFRVNSWREWVISLMGIILPYFYLALLFLWNDNLMYAARLYQNMINNFRFTIERPGPLEFIALGIFAVWIIFSSSRFIADAGEKVISIRKKMWIINHFALAGFVAVLLSGGAMMVMLPLIYIPASAIIAYAVSNSRRTWIHDLLFILTLASAIINRLNL